MTKTLVLVVLALAACTVPDVPDGSFDLLDRQVTLDDNGMQVAVTGCLTGIEGPCDAQGYAMTVTADGVAHPIPVVTVPPDPTVILDTGEIVFRGTIASPSDRGLEVVLAGDTGHVDLPPAFAILPPPAQVSRAASPLVVLYEVLPGATASYDETITCGSDAFALHDLPAAAPGELDLPLADYDLTGTCQHAIQLHQRVALAADSALGGTSGRTERFGFTSNP